MSTIMCRLYDYWHLFVLCTIVPNLLSLWAFHCKISEVKNTKPYAGSMKGIYLFWNGIVNMFLFETYVIRISSQAASML